LLANIATPGVESFHVDQKNSKVTVYGTVKPQAVLEKVLRAGKTAEFWPQPEAAPKAAEPAPAAEEVVGGKKKAVDGGGNGSAKKQKSGKTDSVELVEFDDGDGEILSETDLPPVETADESDTQGLMDKTPVTPVTPAKKGRNRRG